MIIFSNWLLDLTCKKVENYIQGVFFPLGLPLKVVFFSTGPPPKSSKYKKVDLG